MKNTERKINLAQIAEKAGVSQAAVSRVINNRPGVAAEKESRVRDALRELGWRPSARQAGRKAIEQTGTSSSHVVLLLAGLKKSLSPTVHSLINELERILASQHLQMVMIQEASAEQFPEALRLDKVHGVLFVGWTDNSDLHSYLKTVPCVHLHRPSLAMPCVGDAVYVDTPASAQMAVDCLKQQGCRHVAFIHSKTDNPTLLERCIRFKHIAESLGLQVNCFQATEEQVNAWPMHQALMDQFVDDLLTLPNRPDGIFLPSYVQAQLFYYSAYKRGLTPVKDIHVVSCDNPAYRDEPLIPCPHTIDIRLDLVAIHAVRQLQWRMNNFMDPSPIQILIKPTLNQAE